MAKTTSKTVATTKKESLPAKAGAFAAYAGAGMENTNAEDYAIPFFNILQNGSPQVDEARGKALKGAKAGMIFETVSQKMHDGKTGVILVPCAYRRGRAAPTRPASRERCRRKRSRRCGPRT